MRQLGQAVGITVSTVAFSSAGSKIGQGKDMLPQYQAAQWTAFAFGIITFALGIICFTGAGVLGHSTPQPDSISETEKSKSLDERISSLGKGSIGDIVI